MEITEFCISYLLDRDELHGWVDSADGDDEDAVLYDLNDLHASRHYSMLDAGQSCLQHQIIVSSL